MTLCRCVASESKSQSGLLDCEGREPVIAVPQPAWADADGHDVVIKGAFHAVRKLGEVGLQTAIAVGMSAIPSHCTVILVSQPMTNATCAKAHLLRYFGEPRLVSKTNSPRPVAVMPANAACGAPTAPRVAMTAGPR